MGRYPIRAALAGLGYFALVFPVAFAVGVLRTLVVAPRTGALAAVAIEVPFILAVSWLACGWIVRRHRLTAASDRALAGATAFTILMATEFAMSMMLGGTADGFWRALWTASGVLGLAGQVAFAAIPLMRRG